MLLMVFAVSSAMIALLLFDPLRQRFYRRRRRRWHGYYKN